MAYKDLSKGQTGPEAAKYHPMEGALKWILVVCFGYLGFRNARFGRIEAHQAVCAYARLFLIQAMRIIEQHGLRAIHGIVDSLYVQPPTTMPLPTFHQIVRECATAIEATTQIPITYQPHEDYFEFISFLPTKSDPDIGALNRYWGVKPDGRTKVRGVELRRHDAPPFIKRFQEACMAAIARFPDRHQPARLFRLVLLPLVLQYYHVLETNQVPFEDLVITIRLTRAWQHYKVSNYQAIAATLLYKRGIPVGPGEKVRFVIVNEAAPNKLDRVCPVEFVKNLLYKLDHPQFLNGFECKEFYRARNPLEGLKQFYSIDELFHIPLHQVGQVSPEVTALMTHNLKIYTRLHRQFTYLNHKSAAYS